LYFDFLFLWLFTRSGDKDIELLLIFCKGVFLIPFENHIFQILKSTISLWLMIDYGSNIIKKDI